MLSLLVGIFVTLHSRSLTCKRAVEHTRRVNAHQVGREEDYGTLKPAYVTEKNHERILGALIDVLRACKLDRHVRYREFVEGFTFFVGKIMTFEGKRLSKLIWYEKVNCFTFCLQETNLVTIVSKFARRHK